MNNSTIKECICDSEKCRSCPYEALSGNLCAECNTDYYRIENDPLNLGIYFNCYKEPVGYYLDKEDFVYKKCFHTCETCEVKGDYLNNNCIKCNSNYSYQIKKKIIQIVMRIAVIIIILIMKAIIIALLIILVLKNIQN